LLGSISEIDGTPEFHHKILPVGVILSAGGSPVCSRIFLLSQFSDLSWFAQNNLIQPRSTTSEFPLKFKKNPHISKKWHFSAIIAPIFYLTFAGQRFE
jgi:hypothetical protein